ncbi:universal stress protein [Streptomyces gibsoniae]|uniref:Universal stress protein n=1 Tax=Streptomyces gibsoniae TaxID=3075529 RepID=A0ABU2TYW1_9ACTN|nr:universal stress protein [Streptomyces sp. DSM 41699]MDT0466159.1 universal stress protein [Streptomyces sp. DSM 41699]
MSRSDARRPIVVGVDPDPARRTALAWAADEAERRGTPLRLVHAESVPTTELRRWEVPASWEAQNRTVQAAGDQALQRAAAFVAARRPGVEVSALPVEGYPAQILQEQSHDATALVLGSRHLSLAQGLFGSAPVALSVLAHARCPVVVVPEPEHVPEQPPYVVVGVDGSARCTSAVDFAFEEASLHRAALRVLYVWRPGLLGVLDAQSARQECRRLLHETVAGRGAAYPDVELRHELVSGHPAEALTEASADALGLVVGTRGHGAFTGALLGSVSRAVLRRARCPVIVVPLTSR